jgi:hypothetical protein
VESGVQPDPETQDRVIGLPLRRIKDDKVVEGKDGWLFLANDSNRALDQHAGSFRLTDGQVEEWRGVLARRAEIAREIGAPLVVLVAPDNHATYADKLPDWFEPAAERPIHQVLGAARDVSVPLTYPLEQLREARRIREVCSSGDSHWNHFGSFITYRALIEELQPLVEPVAFEDVAFYEIEDVGDLGFKLDRTQRRVIGEVRFPGARLVFDNCVSGNGALVRTECPDAADLTCLLFGDSYSYDVMIFLAETFRRCTFAHAANFDPGLVVHERPDVILNMVAERFLVYPPDEEGGESLEAQEAAKQSEGVVRDPWIWHTIDYPTVRTVERIRAGILDAGGPREAAIVGTLAYAGLRPSELKRLRWSDIGASDLVVRPAGRGEGQLRLGPPRSVPLVRALAEDLARWKALQAPAGDDRLIFPGPHQGEWLDGDWVAWSEEFLEPAARFRDAALRPYELHHTFCLLLINEGRPPEEVARLAGLPADAMLERYGHYFWLAERSPAIAPDDLIGVHRRG